SIAEICEFLYDIASAAVAEFMFRIHEMPRFWTAYKQLQVVKPARVEDELDEVETDINEFGRAIKRTMKSLQLDGEAFVERQLTCQSRSRETAPSTSCSFPVLDGERTSPFIFDGPPPSTTTSERVVERTSSDEGQVHDAELREWYFDDYNSGRKDGADDRVDIAREKEQDEDSSGASSSGGSPSSSPAFRRMSPMFEYVLALEMRGHLDLGEMGTCGETTGQMQPPTDEELGFSSDSSSAASPLVHMRVAFQRR
ncbi:unnamed protein product, partial [Amoebophrya sp. A25]